MQLSVAVPPVVVGAVVDNGAAVLLCGTIGHALHVTGHCAASSAAYAGFVHPPIAPAAEQLASTPPVAADMADMGDGGGRGEGPLHLPAGHAVRAQLRHYVQIKPLFQTRRPRATSTVGK